LFEEAPAKCASELDDDEKEGEENSIPLREREPLRDIIHLTAASISPFPMLRVPDMGPRI